MIDISYSQVSQYLACPSREMYYLRGVRSPKSAALVYGSIFHKVLAARLSGKTLSVADAYKPFANKEALLSEKDWNGDITFNRNDWDVETMTFWMEEAVKLITNLGTRPQAVELMLSRPFVSERTSFNLRGVVDAFWSGKLIDFKLAGKSYKVDTLQAACYALLNGGPSSFYFYVVYKEKYPRLDVQEIKEAKDQKYLDWVLRRVLEPTAEAIEKKVFPANPSYQFCDERWCSYYSLCKNSL